MIKETKFLNHCQHIDNTNYYVIHLIWPQIQFKSMVGSCTSKILDIYFLVLNQILLIIFYCFNIPISKIKKYIKNINLIYF